MQIVDAMNYVRAGIEESPNTLKWHQQAQQAMTTIQQTVFAQSDIIIRFRKMTGVEEPPADDSNSKPPADPMMAGSADRGVKSEAPAEKEEQDQKGK